MTARKVRTHLPDSAFTITTYDELAEHARAFAKGHLNLLLVLGGPGLGKSSCFREAVGQNACWIDGTASPLYIYTLAYRYRNQPLILDDVDGLYQDRNGVRLLKSLCQTEPVKTVAWQTYSTALDKEGVPRQFTTTSRVAIIANQWKSLNADVSALEDRGHVVRFEPTPLEVHRRAATWFWDQDVFNFVANHLHLISRPSFRLYLSGGESKMAGLDWQSAILSRMLSGRAAMVARLLADCSYRSQEERAKAFAASGGGCRATFYNHSKQLRPKGGVPHMKVMGHVPVATNPPPPLEIAGRGQDENR